MNDSFRLQVLHASGDSADDAVNLRYGEIRVIQQKIPEVTAVQELGYDAHRSFGLETGALKLNDVGVRSQVTCRD